MKKRIFNLIVLDESGSMQSIKNAALGHVNESIQAIRIAQRNNENQEHYLSFVSFDSEHITTHYNCVPIAEVKELTPEQYQPCACTPLFDAVGRSLCELRPKVAEADCALVTIVTDGYENASREYTGKAIKALIEELKGKGWIFVYAGANQDVEKVAESMAIHNHTAFEADDDGVCALSEKMTTSRQRLYTRINDLCFDSKNEDGTFFDE